MLRRAMMAGGAGGPPTDPNFASVVSLLHFDGADASTTFTDAPLSRAWTAVGAAQLDTAQSKFGGASLLLDGIDDHLTTPDSADFQFGAGDFTIEAWVRPTPSGSNRAILSQWSSTTADRSFIFYLSSTILVFTFYDTTTRTASAGAVSSLGVWTHVAVVKSAGTVKCYVNGVGGTGIAGGTLQNSTAPVLIGLERAGPTAPFPGHIDELRVTKGVARYTANFTPPAAPFPDA